MDNMKLVLLRHGESRWNRENRFTGWADVALSEQGEEDARAAGRLLKSEGFIFDGAYTSVLKRAIKTLWLAMEELDQMWIPVTRAWELNERHYGSLQGLNKSETAKEYGEQQVHIWRRSFNTPPPLLTKDSEYYPGNDPKYADLSGEQIPFGESLKLTIERVIPFWKNVLVPELMAGQRLLVTAHGNSLRGLIKYLDGMSEQEVMNLNIPTAVPLVYELDSNLKPVGHYYLGDQEKITAMTEAVANQGNV